MAIPRARETAHGASGFLCLSPIPRVCGCGCGCVRLTTACSGLTLISEASSLLLPSPYASSHTLHSPRCNHEPPSNQDLHRLPCEHVQHLGHPHKWTRREMNPCNPCPLPPISLFEGDEKKGVAGSAVSAWLALIRFTNNLRLGLHGAYGLSWVPGPPNNPGRKSFVPVIGGRHAIGSDVGGRHVQPFGGCCNSAS